MRRLMEEHEPCLNEGCQNERANPDEFIGVIRWTKISDAVDAKIFCPIMNGNYRGIIEAKPHDDSD